MDRFRRIAFALLLCVFAGQAIAATPPNDSYAPGARVLQIVKTFTKASAG